jgi:hypothetical protein
MLWVQSRDQIMRDTLFRRAEQLRVQSKATNTLTTERIKLFRRVHRTIEYGHL